MRAAASRPVAGSSKAHAGVDDSPLHARKPELGGSDRSICHHGCGWPSHSRAATIAVCADGLTPRACARAWCVCLCVCACVCVLVLVRLWVGEGGGVYFSLISLSFPVSLFTLCLCRARALSSLSLPPSASVSAQHNLCSVCQVSFAALFCILVVRCFEFHQQFLIAVLLVARAHRTRQKQKRFQLQWQK